MTLALASIVSANLSLQCIVSYLKSHNAYEDVFSSVEDFSGTDAECESFIRIKIDDFNEKILEKMEEDANVKNLIDCFKHEIQSHEYEILTLKLQGVGRFLCYACNEIFLNYTLFISHLHVGMINVGWQFWKSSARETRYGELQKEIDGMGSRILEKCAAVEHFGKFFDATLDKKPSLYTKGENEYCIRRYLIEKSMVDVYSYSFNVNPKKVTMELYNCDVIMKEILEPAYENLRKDETDCSWNVLKDSGYYDWLLKLELLSKLSLSAQDKIFERQKFIDIMFNITKKTREC